jgi:hypothetical protein
MLPAEQPARTTAHAASAAARARLGAGRCERDINIMPIRSRADCNVNTPAGPLPSEAKLLPIQAIGSKLYSCNMTKARLRRTTSRATLGRARQDAGASAKAYDASCGGYE